jgi:hypothetical protein
MGRRVFDEDRGTHLIPERDGDLADALVRRLLVSMYIVRASQKYPVRVI